MKLSDDEKRKIKQLAAKGLRTREIAQRIGRSKSTVYDFLHGRRAATPGRKLAEKEVIAKLRCPECRSAITTEYCVLCKRKGRPIAPRMTHVPLTLEALP